MKIDDGGPAFPNPVERSQGDFGTTDAYPGMSLRDYFAAKALVAIVQRYGLSWCTKRSEQCRPIADVADGTPLANIEHSPEAVHAYALADAMLAVRSSTP